MDAIKDEVPQVAVVLADMLLDELDRDAADPTYNELAAALEAAQKQVEDLRGEVAYWRSKADPASRQMLADLEGAG